MAIVGAGFSGAILALNLLSRLPPDVELLLCERAPHFGKGKAYSTDHPSHFLNVRAANLSPFVDKPGHFTEWLSQCGEYEAEIKSTPAGIFASRRLYGRYLSQLLSEAIIGNCGAMRLTPVPEAVVDVCRAPSGYRLTLEGGREHLVDGVTFAVGNLGEEASDTRSLIKDPWHPDADAPLEPSLPVAIVGSGLTMIDVALRMIQTGFEGPVIAISRHGLVPHSHEANPALPPLAIERLPLTMADLLHSVRLQVRAAQAEGMTWHAVIDAMRPVIGPLWQRLPFEEQRRFLRHLRPWWEIHRHRMAPAVAEMIRCLRESGQLTIIAGSLQSVVEKGERYDVTYRVKGRSCLLTIEVQKVFDATGVRPTLKVGDPLMQRLVESGLVRSDRHRLALDVSNRMQVVGKNGHVSPNLWALGPIVRGVFWECTAVPDIRVQAAELAETILQAMTC